MADLIGHKFGRWTVKDIWKKLTIAEAIETPVTINGMTLRTYLGRSVSK